MRKKSEPIGKWDVFYLALVAFALGVTLMDLFERVENAEEKRR